MTILFEAIIKFERYLLVGMFTVFINPLQELKMIPWMKDQSTMRPHRTT
jgi:hypothetical protein